jgi:hypothetical protein
MTPNEFYALPSISVFPWWERFDRVVQSVLEINDWSSDGLQIEDQAVGRVSVHEKLYHNIDGRRSVAIYALTFDDEPFALMFAGGREQRDSSDVHVTDAGRWKAARTHVLELINGQVVPYRGLTADNEDLTNGYYGVVVARFGDEVRLVDSTNVHPMSGSPVFDMARYEASFDTIIRPLGSKIGFQEGLFDARMLEAAIKVFRSGVLGNMIDLDIDFGDGHRIVAASDVDGQTFVHVIATGGRHYTWAREITPHMVGPASMLECYANFAAGRPVLGDCPYVREAADAFGADPQVVHAELLDFLANGGISMAERIVLTLEKDDRVPERLAEEYGMIAIAYMVVDRPDLRRFCPDGKPSAADAAELIETARDIDAKLADSDTRTTHPAAASIGAPKR